MLEPTGTLETPAMPETLAMPETPAMPETLAPVSTPSEPLEVMFEMPEVETAWGGDVFVEPAFATFQISSARGAVVITEFTSGVDDICLSIAAFKKLGSGSEEGTPLKRGFFVVNTTGLATKSGAQIIYEKDTGELYYDSDGRGGRKATHFATLEDHPALTANDFLLCL